MRWRLLFCASCLISGLAFADIYKWTDSSGEVHFSDKPHPGAEKINLPEVQTFSAPEAAAPSSKDDLSSVLKQDKKNTYSSVNIVQPEDQRTFRNTEGAVSVFVQSEPQLQPGDQYQLLYDGTPLGAAQVAPVFRVKDIYRGSHTLAVQIVNSTGKVLATSQSITIFMMQPRVGMGAAARGGRR